LSKVERISLDSRLTKSISQDDPTLTVTMIFWKYVPQSFACCGIKVAFVDRPEQIDLGKFAALAPQNRGVKVEIFTDLQAAE